MLVVHVTYVALRSIVLERSCLLPNIEDLYINSPVPPCYCRRKYTTTTPLLANVSFYNNNIICKKGRDQCILILRILLFDFSPQ